MRPCVGRAAAGGVARLLAAAASWALSAVRDAHLPRIAPNGPTAAPRAVFAGCGASPQFRCFSRVHSSAPTVWRWPRLLRRAARVLWPRCVRFCQVRTPPSGGASRRATPTGLPTLCRIAPDCALTASLPRAVNAYEARILSRSAQRTIGLPSACHAPPFTRSSRADSGCIASAAGVLWCLSGVHSGRSATGLPSGERSQHQHLPAAPPLAYPGTPLSRLRFPRHRTAFEAKECLT
jgi:hypothetical protein